MLDIIIKNGTVIDGVKNEAYIADVGISGGRIKEIGQLHRVDAKQVVEATGLYVAPGFIDIQNHSDSYFTLLEIPGQDSLLSQGITTIAVGQCGTSLAPLPSPDALKSVQKWRSLAGANINWQNFDEYLTILKNYPLGVNVTSLVGHATMRRGLVGDQVRPATKEEIAIVDKLLEDSLDAGAAGLSLGLVYAHEVNSSQEELLSAAKILAKHGKLLSVHLRSEGSHIVDALNEVIGIAEKSGCALKISHFKIRGEKNYQFLDSALTAIDQAKQRGVNIFFDVYPYTTSWTVLYTYLPKWAYEGGKKSILQNIRNSNSRGKIIEYLKSQDLNLGTVLVATSETNPALTGKTLSQLAINQEVSVQEALLNVLEGAAAQVVVFDRNLSEENLEILLKHPLSVIGSDGAGYDFSYSPIHGLVHPRCFGTMPRFLSLVRDKQLMTWPEAIKKITSRPAEKLKLPDRGKLVAGNVADVTVFEPRIIGSRATYENPYVAAQGLSYVVVNGQLSFSSHEPAIKPAGLVLRV